MQEEHRRAIQGNFSSLVAQTDLDQMVSSLYEKHVFSAAMIEPYKVCIMVLSYNINVYKVVLLNYFNVYNFSIGFQQRR